MTDNKQAAAKALKKLLKQKNKAAAEETAADTTPGRPRTRSMDLAEITNSRPRTRSMDLTEHDGKKLIASDEKKNGKADKKKKKKRKLEEGGEGEDADVSSPQKSKKVKQSADEATDGAELSPAVPTSSAALTAEEFCAQHKILVKADDESFKCPVPMASFDATPFGGPIRSALKAAGYPAPTPTQAQSWPIALSGRDIISVARTGSGKTLGFLLPAFHALLNKPGGTKPKYGSGPSIVVLAPTRELACQISEEASKFGKSAGIRSTTVYGEAIFCVEIFTCLQAMVKRWVSDVCVVALCWDQPGICALILKWSYLVVAVLYLASSLVMCTVVHYAVIVDESIVRRRADTCRVRALAHFCKRNFESIP